MNSSRQKFNRNVATHRERQGNDRRIDIREQNPYLKDKRLNVRKFNYWESPFLSVLFCIEYFSVSLRIRFGIFPRSCLNICCQLEFTKAGLENYSENIAAAESRIRDADIAEEAANLTRLNILQRCLAALASLGRPRFRC